MVCFVILHYVVLSETLSCVDKIKKLTGDKKIVIVDNDSPNRSGLELKKIYKDDEDVSVNIGKKNVGFARGNNWGCEIAKEKFDPDFYVVMNNDVEIEQLDFIGRVQDIYLKEKFDVLGPDIYSTSEHFHQSPKSLKNMTIYDAKKLKKKYEKKLSSNIVVPLRCYIKKLYLPHKIYRIYKNKKRNSQIDFTQSYYNVPLHGACFIFSRSFVNNRKNVFFEDTFFYFESEILDYECQKEGLIEVFEPSIKVLHHQNVATNVQYRNELKKVRFMNYQNYQSISAFLKKYDIR